MPEAKHPFFGNQYTDGGYKTGSFKFPKGLTPEVGERVMETIVSDTVSVKPISPVHSSTPLNMVEKIDAKSKWIIPAIIIASITAVGGYIVCKHTKKKEIVKIPNVGICKNCEEPLTESQLVPDDKNPYIVCKKCGKKNYSHYNDEGDSESSSTNEDSNQ